ncbi:MAG: DVUA0089 family protein [Fibrella sp.]|nr:DVUA0089 family protein [Armatimonadota bacterium]
MRFFKSVLSTALLTTFLSLSGMLCAQAATFTFTSSDPSLTPFVNDNDVQLLSFIVSEPFAELSISTDGYAALGGFDPTLALFTDTGDAATDVFLGQSDSLDFATSLYDDVLNVIVPSGNYVLALTQYDNLANGPDNRAKGFLYDGADNFNFTNPLFPGPGGAFNDFDGNVRNGQFRVNVVTVAVPEAPSAVLVLPGLFALVGVVVRRRSVVKGN